MSTFILFRRKSIAQLRPYVAGEDMSKVSISGEDKMNGSPMPGDWIARNPASHADQWLVAAAYFRENFEAVE